MSDNYTEETEPLFRLLETEEFKFILVRVNHFSVYNRLENDLRKRFPERKFYTADGEKTDYHQLTTSFYELEKGVLFIKHFEAVLANPDIYSGLNIRRDKLADYPIAMICMLSPWVDDLFAKEVMEKMPDMWSFRSMILDLNVVDTEFSFMGLRNAVKPNSANDQEKDETYKQLVGINPNNRIKQFHEHKKINSKKFEGDSSVTVSVDKDTYLKLEKMMQKVLKTFYHYDSIDTRISLPNSIALKKKSLQNLYQGQITEAIKYSLNELAITKQIFDADPDNYILTRNYFFSLINHGDILLNTQQNKEAGIYYNAALFIANKLINDIPERIEFTDYVADALEKVAMFLIEQNENSSAIHNLLQAQKIREKLISIFDIDLAQNRRLALNYATIAIAYEETGKFRTAHINYLHSFHTIKKLIDLYPTDNDLLHTYSTTSAKLGDSYFNFGDFERAKQLYKECEEIDNVIYKKNPRNNLFKNMYANSLVRLGEVYCTGLNNPQEGLPYLKKAKKIWEKLVIKAPEVEIFKQKLESITKMILETSKS